MLFCFTDMPKRTIIAAVKAKAQSGQCLICDADAAVRGLCGRHYEKYKSAKAKRPTKQAKAELDAELIREGKILGPWQVCELTRPNPFED